MNIKILVVFYLIAYSSIAQTFDETESWITRKSGGGQQVAYDESQGILLLLKVQHLSPTQIVTYITEIDPTAVNSIDVRYGKDGWNNVTLNFKTGGTNVKSYIFNKNNEIIWGDPINTHMYGFDVNIETSREQILKFKKAYIHLFKQLGVPVKDGDMF